MLTLLRIERGYLGNEVAVMPTVFMKVFHDVY